MPRMIEKIMPRAIGDYTLRTVPSTLPKIFSNFLSVTIASTLPKKISKTRLFLMVWAFCCPLAQGHEKSLDIALEELKKTRLILEISENERIILDQKNQGLLLDKERLSAYFQEMAWEKNRASTSSQSQKLGQKLNNIMGFFKGSSPTADIPEKTDWPSEKIWAINREKLAQLMAPLPLYHNYDIFQGNKPLSSIKDHQAYDLDALIAQGEYALFSDPAGQVAIKAHKKSFKTCNMPSFRARFPLRISQYFTPIEYDSQDRNYNLFLASSCIDGQIIQPGQTFSFNKTVGPRTYKAGYKDAPVLVKGELISDIAGGICQVSTTLYNAALLGGFKISRRRAHSAYFQDFAYAQLGLDAAVAWDYLDFAFTNSLSREILIFTRVEGKNHIVEIYGSEEPPKVEVVIKDPIMIDYEVENRINSSLKPGAKKVIKAGVNGWTVTTIRRFVDGDHIVEEKAVSNRYASYPALIEIGG